VIDMKQLTT